jgi:hypothetical protein
MRCPDDSDQSGKVRIRVLDSDPDTQQFYFDARMQKSNADAYRTVRNADPDADAGSVVRCCAVPHPPLLRYRCEGGCADPDFGPDLCLNPQTGYRIFFKAKIVKT